MPLEDLRYLKVTHLDFQGRTYQGELIMHKDVAVRIFKSYGWKWGGDWYDVKDYQHFAK